MIIYIIQSNDTLDMIASRFNVTIQKIIEHNWIGADMMLIPGQILFIPRDSHMYGDADFMNPLLILQPYIKQEILYVVQRGDSLPVIARRFDSTAEAILGANRTELPHSGICPGQILRVPLIGFR